MIIECTQKPLFQCSTCGSQLIKEQNRVCEDIKAQFPDAEVLSSTKKLVNALYARFPVPDNEDEALKVDSALRRIDGVVQVTPHGDLEVEAFAAADYIGAYQSQEQFCTSGKDVRIAAVDTGIDYSHYYIGGEGTLEAYQEAYGRGPRSAENRQRDGPFPTEVVVEGYDFIGEFSSVTVPNEDPIDSVGHGTGECDRIFVCT